LLTLVGARTYQLLTNLVAPKSQVNTHMHNWKKN
jgi:hypothetical protein